MNKPVPEALMTPPPAMPGLALRHRYAYARSLLPDQGVALVLGGDADGAALLAAAAARVVVLVADRNALAAARQQHAGVAGLEFQLGTPGANPLPPASVDLVVWLSTPGAGAELDGALASIAKLLRPSGRLLLAPGATAAADAGWAQAVARRFKRVRPLVQRTGRSSTIQDADAPSRVRRPTLLADDGRLIDERLALSPDADLPPLLLASQEALPATASLLLPEYDSVDGEARTATPSTAEALHTALQAQQALAEGLRQQLQELRSNHEAAVRRARDEQDTRWGRRVQERDQLLRGATQQSEQLQQRLAAAEATLAEARQRLQQADAQLSAAEQRFATRLAEQRAELDAERRHHVVEQERLRAQFETELGRTTATAAALQQARDEAAAREAAAMQGRLDDAAHRQQALQQALDEATARIEQLHAERAIAAAAHAESQAAAQRRLKQAELDLAVAEAEHAEALDQAEQLHEQARRELAASRAAAEAARAAAHHQVQQLQADLSATRHELQQAQLGLRRADAREADLAHRLDDAAQRHQAEQAEWMALLDAATAALEQQTEQALLLGQAVDTEGLRSLRARSQARREALRRQLPALPGPDAAATAPSLATLLALPPEAFVDAAYRHVLGRPADPDGHRHYLARLERGEPKLRVLADLRWSAEGRGRSPAVPQLELALRELRRSRIPLWGAAARRRLQALVAVAPAPVAVPTAAGDGPRIDDIRQRIDQLAQGSSLLAEAVPIAVALGQAAPALQIDTWSAARELVECDPEAFVRLAYTTLLLRPPQREELEAELARLSRGASRVFVLERLIRGDESRQRFGASLPDRTPAPTLPAPPPVDVPPPLPAVPTNPVDTALPALPVLSLVIVALGVAPALVRQAVRRLSARPHRHATELIVVADAPSAARLQGLPGATLVPLDDLGHAPFSATDPLRACDAGAAVAQGRLLGFVPADVQALPGAWDELVASVDIFPGTGMAAGRVLGRHDTADSHDAARAVTILPWIGAVLPRHLFEAIGGFAAHGAAGAAAALAARGYRAVFQPLALFRAGPGHTVEPSPAAASGPRLLVVEEAMLQPDRDAGSLCMLNLLMLLRERGWQPVFTSRTDAGSSARGQALLRRCGIEWLEGGVARIDAHLAAEGHRYRAVMLCRPDVMDGFADAVRRHAPQAALLFFPHDLHHLRLQRQAQADDATDAAALEATIQAMRERELKGARQADLTWLLSDAEQAHLAALDASVRTALVPMPHDFTRGEADASARDGAVFVGSFAHAPNRDAVRWLCEAIVPALRRLGCDLPVTVVGAEPPPAWVAAAPPGLRFAGAVDDLDALLARTRIALAPLRYGAGVKGKVLRAAAAGVPLVGTTLAFEGLALHDGEHALVADDAEAFAQALQRLADDDALWRRLADAGHAAMKAAHGPDAAGRRLDEALAAAGLPAQASGYPARFLRESLFYPELRTDAAPAAHPASTISP